jgi:LAO/AO transport system kinase
VVEALVQQVLAGERRALARVISLVENGEPGGYEALRLLYPHTGRAHSIGLTGASGSGKSTLAGALARELRRRRRSVGIVAVDPSSPFTHGALLGDRIRMQELTSDPEIFLRSMATRGSLGGLASATAQVVAVLDAAGKDAVLIETVGAGQDEVEIAGAAETTVVVNTPGTGDDVQALKAGILEIADILVVNKADQPGADTLVHQLQALVSRGDERGIPVLKTVATSGDGVVELVDAIDGHRRYLRESGQLERHRLAQARHQVLALARHELLARVLRATEENGQLDELVGAVAQRDLDPYSAARRLIESVGGGADRGARPAR